MAQGQPAANPVAANPVLPILPIAYFTDNIKLSSKVDKALPLADIGYVVADNSATAANTEITFAYPGIDHTIYDGANAAVRLGQAQEQALIDILTVFKLSHTLPEKPNAVYEITAFDRFNPKELLAVLHRRIPNQNELAHAIAEATILALQRGTKIDKAAKGMGAKGSEKVRMLKQKLGIPDDSEKKPSKHTINLNRVSILGSAIVGGFLNLRARLGQAVSTPTSAEIPPGFPAVMVSSTFSLLIPQAQDYDIVFHAQVAHMCYFDRVIKSQEKNYVLHINTVLKFQTAARALDLHTEEDKVALMINWEVTPVGVGWARYMDYWMNVAGSSLAELNRELGTAYMYLPPAQPQNPPVANPPVNPPAPINPSGSGSGDGSRPQRIP